ncbi:MAG: EscU/YscU/HrcU family type III secretion system export apparatus switch protein [Terricaulis sp.]
MSETEQNKTEEPTPYKIRRARQRGMVARGTDLGFLSVIVGFSAFVLLAGAEAVRKISTLMARLLAETARNIEPAGTMSLIGRALTPAITVVATCALTIVVIVVLLEVIQIRGLVFSGEPFKPDFNRLNPGKNLKRIFSVRMLIETAKSLAKLILYGAAIYFIVKDVGLPLARAPVDGASLAVTWREGLTRLLMSFALMALLFAALDQIVARRDFLKQMRMSRSELNREAKEREGEPRQKQKRKRMHAEFTKQTRALGGLQGADVLIVNPEHYAVALKYDAASMQAPQIAAKGRNRFALLLKQRAFVSSILTISDPPLARALYRARDIGQEIPPAHYKAVADLYLRLRRQKDAPSNQNAKDAHAPI